MFGERLPLRSRSLPLYRTIFQSLALLPPWVMSWPPAAWTIWVELAWPRNNHRSDRLHLVSGTVLGRYRPTDPASPNQTIKPTALWRITPASFPSTPAVAYLVLVRLRMKQVSLYLLFAVAIQSLCYADITKLSSGGSQDLGEFLALSGGSFDQGFATCHSRALCRRQRQARGPGQNWNATDAITDPTLPWKRLVWAAVGSDYYVVHYERGGIDHSSPHLGRETHEE